MHPYNEEKSGEEKTSCPFAHLLPHRDTQGQFNTDLHHFERWRDKENITHRTGMDSCPLLLLWELPSPTRSRNSPWGRSPAQREMLKQSCCILHLLTNICWHPIQLCWKQSTFAIINTLWGKSSPLRELSSFESELCLRGSPCQQRTPSFVQSKDLHSL